MRGVIWWSGLLFFAALGALDTRPGTPGGVVWTVGIVWWMIFGLLIAVDAWNRRMTGKQKRPLDPAMAKAVEEVLKRRRAEGKLADGE